MKKARVILSGGSAYGLAHIGALAAIEKHFEISGIVGTSMGAIIGGLYACGLSCAEMLKLANDKSTLKVFSPLHLNFSLAGIFDGASVLKLFREWTNEAKIEDCPIPFVAISYGLNRRTTIVFDKGDLADAMRASSSLPYIFAPYELGDYLLVDGGVSHPMPLAFKEEVEGELTIAVNVLPPMESRAQYYKPCPQTKRGILLRHNVFMQSLMQNQSSMALHSILQHEPEITIDAHNPELNFIDLWKAQEFYDFGYKSAIKELNNYHEPGFAEKLKERYLELLSLFSVKLKKDEGPIEP